MLQQKILNDFFTHNFQLSKPWDFFFFDHIGLYLKPPESSRIPSLSALPQMEYTEYNLLCMLTIFFLKSLVKCKTTEVHGSAEMQNDQEMSTVTRTCSVPYEIIDHLIRANIFKFPLICRIHLICRFSKTKDDGARPTT